MTTTAAVARRTLTSRHPLIFFFALTYVVSWSFWLLAAQVGGTLHTVLFVAGGFGPATAAALTIRLSGGSLQEWARGIVRWRVGVQYYLYALGLPLLIMLGTNLALAALGQQPAWSSLLDRAPAYLQTFLVTAVIFGGQEEPGWRGFALPRLQSRHSPMIATLILGLAWGVCHIPLYGPRRICHPFGAGGLLHLALQQDPERSAVHLAACQLHPCARSFVVHLGFTRGGRGVARELSTGGPPGHRHQSRTAGVHPP